MQALLKRFARKRHSLGFGIHSPFAYRFITEVLCPPRCYAYYAYKQTGRDRRMRLLVRLLAFFSPASVRICSESDGDRMRAIVAAVLPHAASDSGADCDFIAADSGDIAALMPRNALIFGPQTPAILAGIQAALPYGMTFSNGHDCAVVAALPHLPRQDFDIHL